jgi:N-methylhydantoinase A
MPALAPAAIDEGGEGVAAEALVDRRSVLFAVGAGRGASDTPFYDRTRLLAGNVISGPAVIEQLDSTTVIPPGAAARVHPDGTIVIDIGART